MIKEAVVSASASFDTNYETLIQAGNISTSVNLSTSFYEVQDDASLWGLLINAGYLTIDEVSDEQDYTCTLRIPNNEVLTDIKNITASYLQVQEKDISNLYKSFLKKNKEMFITSYRNLILTNPSYYDIQTENSIHAEWCTACMFMLGICLYIKHDYDIISNREEGYGRCDLILKAKKEALASYVIEFKNSNKENTDVKRLAYDAVKQIEDKQYDTELTGEVIYIGLAHCGKHVEYIWKQQR